MSSPAAAFPRLRSGDAPMRRLAVVVAWLRVLLARLCRATVLLLAALAALVALLVAALSSLGPSTSGTALDLSQLERLAAKGRVRTAVLLDQDHAVQGTASLIARGTPPQQFHTAYPANDATTGRLIARLSAAGVDVRVDPQGGKATIRLLTTTLLPILMLANLFALFFAGRSGRGALGEVEAFGTIDGEGRVAGRVTFADVAGVDEAREELGEVIDYLRDPERYAEVGALPPKGVLLFGPPGCGKTLLARAVAGEAGVAFFSVAGAEFVESLVGVGAARVRDLFAKVRAAAPAIIFIDELDAAGRRRGAGSGGGAEERDNTLNQMLVEMDGFEVSVGIVVVAATNRPDILDPALLRPGRFDRHIVVDRPDVERREAILRLHAAGRPLDPEIDFQALARATPGFTGADLANVLNEAALLTIRARQPRIDAATISEAVQRVLGGPQRRGHLLTDEERRRVGCHEAGHAMVAAMLGQADRVHRVSIVARGRGVGTTALDREDNETIRTAGQLRARLAIALAGRVAEEMELGEASTGAADDLEHATRVAREMAGRHGLVPEVGLTSLLAPDAGQLGVPAQPPTVSEADWAAFDGAVRRLLEEGARAARALLERERAQLGKLVERLLDAESLEGQALADLLPPPPAPADVREVLAAGWVQGDT